MSQKTKEKSLNEAYEELQDLVREFEEGSIDLESAVKKFEEGLKLATFLKTRLTKVQTDIQEVKAKFEDIQE